MRASDWLRNHRRALLDSIRRWTDEKKYRVNELLTRLIRRCDQLDLYVATDDAAHHLQVCAYITTLVMNHLYTGKFKRSR